MKFDAFIEQLSLTASAIQTAYILGKLEADPTKVSINEIGQINMTFIDECRD